jgi:cell division protein FtsZ
MVPEMQEIDDFFDSLNPNIEVIWGISSDNTLGADAKVTILATGMEEIGNCQEEMKDDDYYEDLIRQLYRPIMKKTVESEPIFTVATPPDPEPPEPLPEPPPEPLPGPDTSYTERMKQWIINILKDTEE